MGGWQDEWQSVDVGGLTVDEARERLDVVRERLEEGVSYQGREEDAEHRHELEMKLLKEADGWALREELHASAARSAASDDPEAQAREGQWTSWLAVTFLRKADTAQLAAEAAAPASGEQAGSWRAEVERELQDHRRVDQIADIALEELRRWDPISASQAEGGHLRKLAAAAEKWGGADGLEQFLRRLESVDHEFHDNQLEHFSAAVGREAARDLQEKMEGRDVEVRPVAPIEPFSASLWDDVKSGQVRDDLVTFATVVPERVVAELEHLADAVEHGVTHPLEAAQSAWETVRDLPGDIVDAIREMPDLPDRMRAAWKRLEQADREDQVRAIAEGTVGAWKDLLIDHGVGKVADEVIGARGPDPDVHHAAEAPSTHTRVDGDVDPDALEIRDGRNVPRGTGAPVASPGPASEAGFRMVPEPDSTPSPVEDYEITGHFDMAEDAKAPRAGPDASPATVVTAGGSRVSQPNASGEAAKESTPDLGDAFDEHMGSDATEAPYATTQRLAKGLGGEKAAAEYLAAEGHAILSYKPDIAGTNQPGIDLVTIKDGHVYLIDNKALQRSGNVSSVSALTTNFDRNLTDVKAQLAAHASDSARPAVERQIHHQALEALNSGNYTKAVTNANLIAAEGQIPTGVTKRLEIDQGIEFIDVFQSPDNAGQGAAIKAAAPSPSAEPVVRPLPAEGSAEPVVRPLPAEGSAEPVVRPLPRHGNAAPATGQSQELHEPAPGGGVLMRAEDAPPTAGPEPSEAPEPGGGVLLPPEERAQRELAETGGATTRAEAHREPDPPPEPPPTHHMDPPGARSGADADTTAPRDEHESAGDAGGPAMEAPTGGQAAPAPEPETTSSAQGAVPASTHGDEQPAPPAAQDGDATPPAEEPEQPYPMAGEATQTAEDGDYPMPEPDPVPVVEAPPPEPETQPAEEAPAEEAEGG